MSFILIGTFSNRVQMLDLSHSQSVISAKPPLSRFIEAASLLNLYHSAEAWKGPHAMTDSILLFLVQIELYVYNWSPLLPFSVIQERGQILIRKKSVHYFSSIPSPVCFLLQELFRIQKKGNETEGLLFSCLLSLFFFSIFTLESKEIRPLIFQKCLSHRIQDISRGGYTLGAETRYHKGGTSKQKIERRQREMKGSSDHECSRSKLWRCRGLNPGPRTC